jgi:hypothetical protein
VTIPRYGDHNYHLLVGPSHAEDGAPQALPRQTVCGSPEAMAFGLAPVLDFPDVLVQPADYKAVITHCHEAQVFAQYHQAAAGVFAKGWDQDGYGFCWAYGLAAATMACRATEGQAPVRLAPFSLGWLVGWRNRGFYLDGAIKGACEQGIASAEFVPEYELNTRNFKAGWEADALKYRPLEFFDTRRSDGEAKMIQQCLSILATGRPLYIAYNWWGHALQCCAMRWDEKERNSIVWVIRNSHNEKDVIELVGTKGVPDEAYGVRATNLTT